MSSILVADDEKSLQDFLVIMLEEDGYQVVTASSVEKVTKLIRENEFDLILTDIRMGRSSGIDVLDAARNALPDTPVVMMTAYASEEFRTVKSQPWIFIKLSETPGLHGVVFFTALQFSYGSKFNLKLFNKIINNDYEIHFAREDISFSKENRNFEGLDFLLFNSLTLHRKEKELFELI